MSLRLPWPRPGLTASGALGNTCDGRNGMTGLRTFRWRHYRKAVAFTTIHNILHRLLESARRASKADGEPFDALADVLIESSVPAIGIRSASPGTGDFGTSRFLADLNHTKRLIAPEDYQVSDVVGRPDVISESLFA